VNIHKLDFLRKAQLLHVARYCIGMCKYNVVMLYNNTVSATEFMLKRRMLENIVTICENVFQKGVVMVVMYTAPRRSLGKYDDLPCLTRFMSN